MTYYRITNLLMTSIKIEDLGITLHASGGHDSVCQIDSDSYNRSVSLREHLRKNHVSIQSSITTPLKSNDNPVKVVPLTSVPASSPVLTSHAQHLEIAELRFDIMTKFDEILSLLRSALISQNQVNATQLSSAYQETRLTVQSQVREVLSDPIFIPSRIVPENVDVHISVHHNDEKSGNFDNSLDALRKIRKKSV